MQLFETQGRRRDRGRRGLGCAAHGCADRGALRELPPTRLVVYLGEGRGGESEAVLGVLVPRPRRRRGGSGRGVNAARGPGLAWRTTYRSSARAAWSSIGPFESADLSSFAGIGVPGILGLHVTRGHGLRLRRTTGCCAGLAPDTAAGQSAARLRNARRAPGRLEFVAPFQSVVCHICGWAYQDLAAHVTKGHHLRLRGVSGDCGAVGVDSVGKSDADPAKTRALSDSVKSGWHH